MNYEASYILNDKNGQNKIISSSGKSETVVETLDSEEDVTVAFTNSKIVTIEETVKKIDITAVKKWSGDQASDRPKSITVYLERYLSGFPNNVETVDTATLTPHNSEWRTVFNGFPEVDDQGREYVYSVREESVAGYTCSVEASDPDPLTGNQQFTITNTKIPTYDLTISKTVKGAFGNKAKQFECTVTLKDSNDKPLNGFYTLKRGDTEIPVLFDVYGQAKIGVSHGEDAVIKNLPVGTKFIVTETDYSKRANATGNVYDEDIKDIKRMEEEIWHELKSI